MFWVDIKDGQVLQLVCLHQQCQSYCHGHRDPCLLHLQLRDQCFDQGHRLQQQKYLLSWISCSLSLSGRVASTDQTILFCVGLSVLWYQNCCIIWENLLALFHRDDPLFLSHCLQIVTNPSKQNVCFLELDVSYNLPAKLWFNMPWQSVSEGIKSCQST